MATVEKTFRCIEALSAAPSGLTVSEVAATAGLSRPGAIRLLDSLAKNGFAIRDARSKRYRLGLKLYEWSIQAVQAGTPINIARKELVRLSVATGRECNLLVLEGLDVVFLERCEEIDGLPLNRSVAGRRAWYQTATGKAIVAFSAPETQKSILDRTSKLPDVDAEHFAALRQDIERTAERGYGVTGSMRADGLLGLGVPILGQAGFAVAALGTFLPSAQLETPEGSALISQMTATAGRVSHYLGYEFAIREVIS